MKLIVTMVSFLIGIVILIIVLFAYFLNLGKNRNDL
jgi:maltodextrin utilization protein YvdJ